MAIELFRHNEEAYNSALKMLKTSGKSAIIHPTGTGKSFIGFKLCEDFQQKSICWLSPSDYIFKTQIENLKKASGGYEPDNITFFTYAKLMNMDDAQIQKSEAIGIRWENINDLKWSRYYEAAQKYYKEHGNLRVAVTEDKYDGVELGRWISQLRNYRKSGTHTATLTPERISDLDKIGMIWDVYKAKRYRNYEEAEYV